MAYDRIIAVGDVHGFAQALQCLLHQIAPGPSDLLVMLGDYVDRGPDSQAVVQQLIELSERVEMRPLLGNHEEMLLAVVDGTARPQVWLPHGGTATLESYGFSGSLDCIPQRHLEFFRGCLNYVELDDFFCVHANYDAQLPLAEQPAELLRWESLERTMPGPHVSGKAAVVGHTPDRSGEILDLGYLKCLDTYCYGGQWLTAMDLLSGNIWQVSPTGELRSD